jgi:hypothetical protein
MLVVVVDFRDIWVGDYNKRKVPQTLDAMREADGEEGEREVCRGEEGLRRERRASMSVGV